MAFSSQQLEELIQPLPIAAYSVDLPLNAIETTLESYAQGYGLNLEPDFQRGHVWSESQRQRFIESLLRRALDSSSLLIQFNAPHWDDDGYAGHLSREIQLIDGLQRLTSVRKYIAGEIKPFGLSATDLEGTRYGLNRTKFMLRFSIHALQTEAEVLRYYLDLNTGGTPHAREEIERVHKLYQKALGATDRPMHHADNEA